MLRRLPVYLLLDCSESMAGGPLEEVEAGTEAMLSALRRNPHAMETVYISVITFNARAKQVTPLTELPAVHPPKLSLRPGTCLGAALDVLHDAIKREVVPTTPERKGDYRPLAFILTDGQPTDEWRGAAQRLRSVRPRLASVYSIGCGVDVDFETLGQIGDVCIHMRYLSPASFADFFVWMSASVQSMSIARDNAVSLEKIPLKEGMELVDPENPPSLSSEGRRLFFHVCCSETRRHYLMRYVFESRSECYLAQDAIPLPEDFFSDGVFKSPSVSSGLLYGSVDCPFCGNDSWGQCGACRNLFCLKEGHAKPSLVCPVCETKLTMSDNASFDIQGSQG
jgi:uncharacterized protein YegL